MPLSDFFRIQIRETKFSNVNSYRKNAILLSFSRNRLFLISQTIMYKISWDYRQKTAIGRVFSDTKCPKIPAVSMIGENP